MKILPTDDAELIKAKLKFMVMSDLMIKTPPFAVFVAIYMGGMAYGFVWFIMNVLKPFILNYH